MNKFAQLSKVSQQKIPDKVIKEVVESILDRFWEEEGTTKTYRRLPTLTDPHKSGYTIDWIIAETSPIFFANSNDEDNQKLFAFYENMKEKIGNAIVNGVKEGVEKRLKQLSIP